MKRLSQSIRYIAVSVFTLGLVAVLPAGSVSAETGSGSGGDPNRITSTDDRSGGGSDRKARVAQANSTDDDGTADQGSGDTPVTTKPAEIRERAKALVSEKRVSGKEKSLEVRQKSCEARKANIVKRSANYSRNATKHLNKFNGIYDKVLAFKAAKNLTAENFDALKAETDAKKAAATEAVAAIANVTTDIDCASDDPAATVASVKESVKNARTALHEYRLSIKDLVIALQKAVDTTAPDDSGSTESNDSGTDSAQDQAEAN